MVPLNRALKTAKAAAKVAVRRLTAALAVVVVAVGPAPAVKRGQVVAVAAANRAAVAPAVTHRATPPVVSRNGKNRPLKAAATASR
jgi:CTP:molybdopterin cytidylyltransferase MocA